MFDVSLFDSLFNQSSGIETEDERISAILESYDESEEEKMERKRLIALCHSVMVAEKYEDVDVSLDDLVKLASVYEDVKNLYCTEGSGDEFRRYETRMGSVRTVLKRRVL